MSALEQQAAPDAVLAKALFRASEQLDLKQSDIAAVLGMDRTAVSRLKQSQSLDPASKHGELALLLVRLARTLFALAGGDEDWVRHFMRSPNKVTGGVPAEQVMSIQGLMAVLQFVESIRENR